jgi:hypothetical protein
MYGLAQLDPVAWLQKDMQGQRTVRIGYVSSIDISLTQENGAHKADF